MSQEILEQIRTGLDLQIKQVIAEDDIPQIYVHEVTQSYLLLQILEKLDRLDGRLKDVNEGKNE